jgi:putative SOS response-associated peptidase YedK
MCNAYTVRPKVTGSLRELAISTEAAKRSTPLVRRTGKGIVAVNGPSGWTAKIMRWGIQTPRFDSINNARSDKLTSPIWAESLQNRRCIVPITSFFEWQELPHRAKQPFEFHRPDHDWMWVAGLYSHSRTYGDCYATITTDPPEWMVSIHDRMLAVLDFDQALEFLHHGFTPGTPYAGEILATPCASPLKQAKPQGKNQQGELF